MLEWPVANSYKIWSGKIWPYSDEARLTLPLANSKLFSSFAQLGKNGAPSEKSILGWVHRHGLLRREGQPTQEEPESWLEDAHEGVIQQAPISLEEFRTEVRTAYQLLRLYLEIRERNGEAVLARFANPPSPWPNTPRSLVDRYISKYQTKYPPLGEQYRTRLKEWGIDLYSNHLKLGLDILRRCVKSKLKGVNPLPYWNWWDKPPPGSSSIGIVRWLSCPDLLSAMYLQFHLLISAKTSTRICANPNCRMPFLATRKDKLFCAAGCRSTGRNHPH